MDKIKYLATVAMCALGLLLFSACSGGGETAPESEPGESTVQPELPSEYAGLTNPLTSTDETISQGARLYQSNCASCHGDAGQGDGPAGVSLEPRPSNLAANEDSLSDDYLFWRISEGGMFEPFNSMMPGWDSILREEQIWQVITYIRELGSDRSS